MGVLGNFLKFKNAASALAMAAMATGCVSPVAGNSGLYARPIGNAPVTVNPTPYSQALVCIGEAARAKGVVGPRVAVGRILDYTGKVDVEGGRRITQGASLMAITAFAKAGARLVERFDTSVSELELRYANNKLIGDAPNEPRPISAAQVPGSDYYLVGGITEMNYDIRSSGVDAFVGDKDATDPKGTFTGKLFVMNIGIDLRLVSTQTLEVVDVVSYQKQIVGREIRAGVFAFSNNNIFDIGGGERALEPVQMAVRSSIERAVVEMMSNLYGQETSEACADSIRAGGDPIGSASAAGNFRANANPAVAAANRVDPNAWHARRDPAIRGHLEAQAPTVRTLAQRNASATSQMTASEALVTGSPDPTIDPVAVNAGAAAQAESRTDQATATAPADAPGLILIERKPAPPASGGLE